MAPPLTVTEEDAEQYADIYDKLSIIRAGSSTRGACDTCGGRGTARLFMCTLDVVTPAFYERLVSRNWFRLGATANHVYNLETCCPAFRLRVDVNAFKLSGSQRATLESVLSFVTGSATASKPAPSKKAAKFDALVREPEHITSTEVPHRVTVTFEDPSLKPEYISLFTRRVFPGLALASPMINSGVWFELYYCKKKVINVAEDDKQTIGTKFLVVRLDGTVIALHVVDALPDFMVSIDLMVDPRALPIVDMVTYVHLRTIAHARQLHKKAYLPGFYSSADKKTDKLLEFCPLFILDSTHRWRALEPNSLASEVAMRAKPVADELTSEVLDDVMVMQERVKWKAGGEFLKLKLTRSNFGNVQMLQLVKLRPDSLANSDAQQMQRINECIRVLGPSFVKAAGQQKELAFGTARDYAGSGATILQLNDSGYRSEAGCQWCDVRVTKGYVIHAATLSPGLFERLISSGWNRDGIRLNKTDNNSCCPEFTIRIEVNKFEMSGDQRDLLECFARLIRLGDAASTSTGINVPTGFNELVHAADASQGGDAAHSLRATLAEATNTAVKRQFAKGALKELAKRGMRKMHSFWDLLPLADQPEWFRCYVDSPFILSKAASRNEVAELGTRHYCLFIDNVLVGLSVVDVLPSTLVVNARFIDVAWQDRIDLESIMTLRELAIARDLGKKHYIPGFWVPNIKEMVYLERFRTQGELLDPETKKWHAFNDTIYWLKQHPHAHLGEWSRPATFVKPCRFGEQLKWRDLTPPPRGSISPSAVTDRQLMRAPVVEGCSTLYGLLAPACLDPKNVDILRECVAALGPDIVEEYGSKEELVFKFQP